MSKQPVHQIGFDFLPRLPIVVEPKEVDVSSDAGILPLRQFDDQIGFTARFIDCLGDPRDPDQIEHTFPEMVCRGIENGFIIRLCEPEVMNVYRVMAGVTQPCDKSWRQAVVHKESHYPI